MDQSLLFLPDISGFTKFVQTTEVEHSQHVIAELLEILIGSNQIGLELAEIEGDALFFYKEKSIPSLEEFFAQVESMFVNFHSHLKLLEENRICPCRACSSAPKLELKIIAHAGPLQFISVQNNRKPFGAEVIEAHRLMKNSVQSDNYVLISESLAQALKLPQGFKNDLFQFELGKNEYDGKDVPYRFSVINKLDLQLKPFILSKKMEFDGPPAIHVEKDFPIAADTLFEYITNYKYRPHWIKGVDRFEYDENQVTRNGSSHACVINNQHFNFQSVIKDVAPGQLVYGELTFDPPPMDELYQFYILTPLSEHSCKLEIEVYWKSGSPIKKLMLASIVKMKFRQTLKGSLTNLYKYAVEGKSLQLS